MLEKGERKNVDQILGTKQMLQRNRERKGIFREMGSMPWWLRREALSQVGSGLNPNSAVC